MNSIAPNWKVPSNVKALSSTRIGGFSLAPYQGLNLGMHVGDQSDLVEKNRQWLTAQSAMPSAPIWLNQTHSTTVVEVTTANRALLSRTVVNADALVTKEQGVVCSAMTADCLPLLLTDTKGTQVAAVHAGWRGLADGMVEAAVAHFKGDVIAWLGPVIGPLAFEVGEDVRQAFIDHSVDAVAAFKLISSQKWLADMNMLAIQRLTAMGVSHLYNSGLCTYSDPQRFYSYRRDGITGRQASFIWLE